jgi:hypothetical protein
LGVQIDEKCRASGESEAGANVDRGRGLADAALLIDDCDGFGGQMPPIPLMFIDEHGPSYDEPHVYR